MLKQDVLFLSHWLLLLTLNTNCVLSFQPQPQPLPRIHHGHSPQQLSASSDSSSLDMDFSSPYFWEEFYELQQATMKPGNCFEWHDSISLPDLAAYIPADSNCLMVGCGNSNLPQVVLDRKDNIHVTLLDTSKACIEQLQAQYANEEVSFVCGSATEMASYFVDSDDKNTNPNPTYFDSIVDKGLTDAFMCGDAWEQPTESLLRESSKLFHSKRGGQYVLVSYKMRPAIQELFQEMCDAVSEDLVWEWEFDCPPLSNDRVSVSIATVRPKD